MEQVTPLRKQYLEVKSQHYDSILLFRLGDFYEAFDEDAEKLSQSLDIVLTSREMGKGQRVKMAGIPHHALDSYLPRLIRQGHKVAICEQTGVADETRSLFKREVVRKITPGTIIEPNLLNPNNSNHLLAIVSQNYDVGIAYTDISTGNFFTTQISIEKLITELDRIEPKEIILLSNDSQMSSLLREIELQIPISILKHHSSYQKAKTKLLKHFNIKDLEDFGLEKSPLALQASINAIDYLRETQMNLIPQIKTIKYYSTEEYMILDVQTKRNLELFQGGRFGGGKALINTIDATKTPMGGRLFNKWIGQPLLNRLEIENRLNSVEWFTNHRMALNESSSHLSKISDIERLINRLLVGTASPRDLISISESIKVLPLLIKLLKNSNNIVTQEFIDSVESCKATIKLIDSALNEDSTGLKPIFNQGYSKILDIEKDILTEGRNYILKLEQQEQISTGIKSLKVGFNRIYGYYIEVSKSNLEKIPEKYIRRQTLTNAERFITEELKKHERSVLESEKLINEIEGELFDDLCNKASSNSMFMLIIAKIIAEIDCFRGLAEIATKNNYVKPILSNSSSTTIIEGRHPIVEELIPNGTFIPNDTQLDHDQSSLVILTGPNMSGKSTYIRQVALIQLMTQIGSFVPAKYACIDIADRIFTRVGLQDDLGTGQSTFMVEMVETAMILSQATTKSLIILDEIGRGTSTFDGLAIAQAVAEHIHESRNLGSKTLFATHYHELTKLEESLSKLVLQNVAVEEINGKVIFLHKIYPGKADKSYGIQVGELAGLPKTVTQRAFELLKLFESENNLPEKESQSTEGYSIPKELMGIIQKLKSIDIAETKPIDAINLLNELRERITRLQDKTN